MNKGQRKGARKDVPAVGHCKPKLGVQKERGRFVEMRVVPMFGWRIDSREVLAKLRLAGK